MRLVSRKKKHFLIRVIIGTKNNDIWKKKERNLSCAHF